MSQVNLIAAIPTTSEQLQKAAALLLDYQSVVRAEPGNLRFELYRAPDDSAIFVVERYASEEAFQAHLSHPANAELNANLAVVLAGGGSALQMLDTIE